MSGPQQGQQGQGDNGLGPLWIVATLLVAGGAAWYFLHTYIVIGFFAIKKVELSLIGLFDPAARELAAGLSNTNPALVKFKDLSAVANTVGKYFSIPVAVILGFLGIMLYRHNAGQKFNRRITMESLVDMEKENWPQITPIAQLDLINTPLDEGPWAMAMTPMLFAKKMDLLDVKEVNKKKMRFEAKLKKAKARSLLALQLGKPWTDLNDLPIHIKALFAIFAARGNRDREGAYGLMDQISRSTKHGKLDFNGVDKLLAKHAGAKNVGQVVGHHAYVLTVMASMLELARTDGVLATAEFLWLKPVDRRLWYTLNTVGRLTAVPEVAGVYAHWLAEKELMIPLRAPMIEEAVKGLELAVEERIYDPENEDY